MKEFCEKNNLLAIEKDEYMKESDSCGYCVFREAKGERPCAKNLCKNHFFIKNKKLSIGN